VNDETELNEQNVDQKRHAKEGRTSLKEHPILGTALRTGIVGLIIAILEQVFILHDWTWFLHLHNALGEDVLGEIAIYAVASFACMSIAGGLIAWIRRRIDAWNPAIAMPLAVGSFVLVCFFWAILLAVIFFSFHRLDPIGYKALSTPTPVPREMGVHMVPLSCSWSLNT
jgi:hypothetical protein